MTINAPDVFPMLVQFGISRPWLAVFIVLNADSLNRKTIVRAEFIIVMLEVISHFSVVGSTMDFGIKEHVRGELVALDQDIIADNWGFLPGNMKPA